MYQAGIYCRISIEEQNKEGEYSNSIHSQIQMARDYIAENKDIAEKKVYVDDGASGSNFERTEFRRMLADIELGVINMVIFKDVSRLGREHIDTNYYLGKYFPEKQIRIVSILDNYDSAVGTYDEMLEIKTLLNDMYLRDTSRKIKTTIQTKRSMGEYTPKQPPFGYVKSKTIHNHLEIDPYAAEVVRRIYRMYQNGFCNAAWYRDERKCSHKSISEEKLQKIVRSELTRQFQLSDLRKKDMSAISSAVFLTKIKEIQAEIRKLDADMERHSEKLAQAFMQYKEGELSKEAYIEMKDDRNNWKVFCEDRKKSLEQTIRKLEKQQKKEARFLRSLLELGGTTRINAELAESLIESMYLYGDNRLEINFGFKGAVEYE